MCVSPAVPRVSGSMRLTYSAFFPFITHSKLHPLTDERKERKRNPIQAAIYLKWNPFGGGGGSLGRSAPLTSPPGASGLYGHREGAVTSALLVLTLHSSAPLQETLTIRGVPLLLLLLSEASESRLIAPPLDPWTPPTLVKAPLYAASWPGTKNLELELK